jgi:hypothetical protein
MTDIFPTVFRIKIVKRALKRIFKAAVPKNRD